MHHVARRARALLDVLVERAHYDLGRLQRDGRVEVAQRREAERRLELRVAPGEQMMHRGGKRVEIRARLDLAHVLLRRGVADRAYLSPAATRRQEARDAEVDEHRAAVLVDHNVAGLEVAVDDRRRLRVQEAEHIENLARPAQHLGLGQPAAGAELVEHPLQIAASNELHHQVVAIILGEVVDDVGDARMGKHGEYARLAREVLDRLLLGNPVADDHLLDGDRATGEPGVVGEIDPSHPTLAEHLVHAVATVEHPACGKLLTRFHFTTNSGGRRDTEGAATDPAAQRRPPRPRLGNRLDDELEEGLADDDFVAGFDLHRIAGHQARLAVDVGAVETADVLDGDLTAFDPNKRMLARNLGLGVVLVEVDLGKRAGLGIPSPDQVIAVLQRKLVSLASAADNLQLGAKGGGRGRRLGLRLNLAGGRLGGWRRGGLGRAWGRRGGLRARWRRRSFLRSGGGPAPVAGRRGAGGGRFELGPTSVAVIETVNIFVAAFAALDHRQSTSLAGITAPPSGIAILG